MFFNELTRIVWGRQPLFMDTPPWLAGSVHILPGIPYPSYRLAVIGVGVLVAVGLYLVFTRTRLGMQIRAGASNREMAGPILAVEAGMGESMLILTFVVIVVGGIGSVRRALVGALLVGLVDTLGRAFLPTILRLFLSAADADGIAASLASMSAYLLMAGVLVWRPRGLLPSHD